MARPLGSRYELLDVIAQGTSGEVWRGRVLATSEPIAVKLLRAELATNPQVVDRFVRERHLLRSIQHPAVVRLRELVVDGDDVGLVMDLVPGSDLRRHLSGVRTLAPATATEIVARISDALAAAHAVGVVHSDVKPANILVPSDGSSVRLVDFGVARLTRRTEEPMPSYGTPEYAAPEVIKGSAPMPASDVYALGIVGFELLVGVTPYHADNVQEILQRHVRAEPIWPDTIPSNLRWVLGRCLAADPTQRPSAQVLATQLRACLPDLVGRPAAAVPPPGTRLFRLRTPSAPATEAAAAIEPSTVVLRPTPKPSSSRGTLIGALAGAAAVIVLIAAVLVLAFSGVLTPEGRAGQATPTPSTPQTPTQPPTQEPSSRPSPRPSESTPPSLNLPSLPGFPNMQDNGPLGSRLPTLPN